MGLLDVLMPYQPGTTGNGPNRPAVNPWTNWVNQNPYNVMGLGQALSGFGSGMVGASNLHDALTGATQGLQNANTPAYLQLQMKKVEEDKAAQAAQQQQTATVKWLMDNGHPEWAQAVQMGGVTGADALKNVLNAKNNDVQYGLNAVWGRDQDGNPVIAQLSNQGGLQVVQPPDGVTFGKDPIKIETPTKTILLDPVTRQPIGEISKDNRGAAFDSALGKAEGEAVGTGVTGAPRAALQAQQADDVANKILSNPVGLDEIFGNVMGIPQQMTPAWPGTKKADALNDINELIAKSWLTVRADLKGAGQVTDYEGAKAQAAVSQMEAALKSGSKEAFIQAVKDYQTAVRNGYAIIAQQSAQGGITAPSLPPPSASQDNDPLGIR